MPKHGFLSIVSSLCYRLVQQTQHDTFLVMRQFEEHVLKHISHRSVLIRPAIREQAMSSSMAALDQTNRYSLSSHLRMLSYEIKVHGFLCLNWMMTGTYAAHLRQASTTMQPNDRQSTNSLDVPQLHIPNITAALIPGVDTVTVRLSQVDDLVSSNVAGSQQSAQATTVGVLIYASSAVANPKPIMPPGLYHPVPTTVYTFNNKPTNAAKPTIKAIIVGKSAASSATAGARPTAATATSAAVVGVVFSTAIAAVPTGEILSSSVAVSVPSAVPAPILALPEETGKLSLKPSESSRNRLCIWQVSVLVICSLLGVALL